MQVLAFHSRGERYLVRLDAVRAVVRLRGLRRMPGTTGALVGVLDVQSTSVAIYDTRSDGAAESSGDVLVLAAGWPEHAIGVACDGALELLDLPEESAAAAGRLPELPSYVETLLRLSDTGELVPLVDVMGLAEAGAGQT